MKILHAKNRRRQPGCGRQVKFTVSLVSAASLSFLFGPCTSFTISQLTVWGPNVMLSKTGMIVLATVELIGYWLLTLPVNLAPCCLFTVNFSLFLAGEVMLEENMSHPGLCSTLNLPQTDIVPLIHIYLYFACSGLIGTSCSFQHLVVYLLLWVDYVQTQKGMWSMQWSGQV